MPTAALDALTAKHTAFPNFGALLAASKTGYSPTIRLDLTGERDGLALAHAFNHHSSREALVWRKSHGQFAVVTAAAVAASASRSVA